MRHTRITAILLAFSLVLAACGGGDEAETTTTHDSPTTTAPRVTTTTEAPARDLIPPDGVGTTSTTSAVTDEGTLRHPAEACESPDETTLLVVQQQACTQFIESWLSNTVAQSAFRINFWSSVVQQSPSGGNELMIVMGAEDPPDSDIVAFYLDAQIATQMVPEWLIDEETLQDIEAQTQQGIQEQVIGPRTDLMGITMLAFASYAELLDIDEIVLRVAYPNPNAEAGWNVIDYRIAPDTALDLSPGTFGDFLLAVQAQDQEALVLITSSLADIVNAAEQTAVEPPVEEATDE